MNLKDLLLGGGLVIGTFLGVGAVASAVQKGDSAPTASFETVVSSRAKLVGGGTPPLTAGLLAGRPVETANNAPASRRPIAVMVDNNVAALPQTGLDRADIVIEALVEGGITRFLAVYHSQDAVRLGPVRSARTPFLHWALEYDAVFAHVGSSDETGVANAGLQIEEWKIADLDYQGKRPVSEAFSRDGSREAPHNVYTSTARLRSAADGRSYSRAPRFQPWPFETKALPPNASRPPATRLTVGFGALSPFTVRWEWDASSRTYLRSEYGAAQLDSATGKQLAASNVVVQYARSYVADGVGHVLIDNVGQGRAQVFMDGVVIEATWRKSDSTSRTRFYSQAGVELSFRPGATWIEVVDVSGGVRID